MAFLLRQNRAVTPRGRSAFTIVEMVVAVAMMAIVAAITLPSIVGYLDRQKITDTVSTLSDLATALNSFRTTVGGYPSRLSQLGGGISTTVQSSCGINYSATSSSKWIIAGPFYPKATSVTGFPLPIGTANDLLVRSIASSSPGFLQIVIPSVRYQDATLLNDQLDGTTDANQVNRSNTTGAIQWGAPDAAERVTLTYNLAVNRGC